MAKRDPALLVEAFQDVLSGIGETVTRGGLRETPERAAKAWLDWTSGYEVKDPASVLKVFEDGGEGYDEMVIVRGIDVFSHCEHHLAPFFGTADVAYIPSGKVVGLSKLARLVEVYSKRLQIQERLTVQIATTLMQALEPLGVGVVIKAKHMCMCSRGVRHTKADTVTSSLLGVMRKPAVRSEFLRLCEEG